MVIIENSREVPRKIKKQIHHMIQQSQFWVYIQRKQIISQEDNTCNPMFIEAFFTVAKILNQTKCASSIKWINRCIFNTCNVPCICIYVYVVCMDIYVYIYITYLSIDIYIHEDYSSIWKRDSAICKNMSKVREHYLG